MYCSTPCHQLVQAECIAVATHNAERSLPWRNRSDGSLGLSGCVCFVATRTNSLMCPLDSSE